MYKNIAFELKAKALSVNAAWQGRRYKSKAYSEFEKEIGYLLPRNQSINGEVKIEYIFGLKNYKLTDVDNLIKPIQDLIVKAGIIDDDRKIVQVLAIKVASKKDVIGITITKI
ncbi:MAG: RusA family crossover junction endodeoxyribonuclease [Nanoarchaeota archaeon]